MEDELMDHFGYNPSQLHKNLVRVLIQKSVCYEYPIQSFFDREEDRQGNQATSLYPIKKRSF